MKIHSSGYTFIEVIVVIGIVSILFLFATVSLLGTQRKPALTSAVSEVMTDLRQQQVKAMSGETGGGVGNSSYGVYFGQSQYVLFRGTSYVPSDSSNIPIPLDASLQFVDVTFPGSIVVFSRGAGEILNFSLGNNAVAIYNTQNNERHSFTLNRYGVIDSMQ